MDREGKSEEERGEGRGDRDRREGEGERGEGKWELYSTTSVSPITNCFFKLKQLLRIKTTPMYTSLLKPFTLLAFLILDGNQIHENPR